MEVDADKEQVKMKNVARFRWDYSVRLRGVLAENFWESDQLEKRDSLEPTRSAMIWKWFRANSVVTFAEGGVGCRALAIAVFSHQFR